jgi:predicted nucleic acid-binding protein
MRVVFDSNVLLDAIALRPDYQTAQKLIMAVSQDKIQGVITANSITDIYYVARKYVSDSEVREIISNLLSVFDIAPVDGDDCATALGLPMKDFEDAVLAVCAVRAEADYIVTRDEGLICEEGCPISAVHPSDILNVIRDSE